MPIPAASRRSQLFTVAESTDPLSATAGLTVVLHHTYDTAPQPHVIVVPAHQATDATQVWLKQAAANADLVMSVCIGAFIIAQAGLLDGLEGNDPSRLPRGLQRAPFRG